MDITLLTNFSKLVSAQQIRADENARATHSDFNVFTIVLKADDEVRLHTRFLHNLLDPCGTHNCGGQFLELFFETLEELPPTLENKHGGSIVPDFDHPITYRVQKEASTSEGQIDLLLSSEKMGIAIENKIYAAEGNRQLKRYSDYLESKFKDPTNRSLFFLTLEGKPSHSHEGAAYYRISYNEHILHWLEKCLQSTYAIPPINQTLIQYRNVVRQLTGNNPQQKIMSKIKEHLIKNPDLIRMREGLNQGVESLKAEVLTLLGESIIEEITPHHHAQFRTKMTADSFGADSHGSIRLSPTSGPFADKRYQIVIEHFSKWNALIIGVEAKWENLQLRDHDAKILAKLNELLNNECSKKNIHKADPQKTWSGEYWPAGWQDLLQNWPVTDEVVIQLLDEHERTALAKEVIKKSLRYIEMVERLHIAAEKALESPQEE